MLIFDNNPRYHKPEDRHVFVVVANDAVRDSSQLDSQTGQDSLRDLFTCMTEAIETSMKLKIRNCGFHGDLPWLDTLLTFAKRANATLVELLPISLVDSLEGSFQAQLLTDPSASQKISQLRSRLSDPRSDVARESPRSTRSPRLDSPEQAYFGRSSSTQYSHRPALSSSSSTRLLMPSFHSPTSLTSWREDGQVELGTIPFPTPVTPDISPIFAYQHPKGGTWPS